MEYLAILITVSLIVILLLFKEYVNVKKVKDAELEADRILDNAKRKSDTLLKEASIEAKDRLFRMKSEFDLDSKETKSELKKMERRLFYKEENIDRKASQLEKRETGVNTRFT